MNKVDKAASKAKKLLKKRSRNIGHDLVHHQAVWNNCKQIVKGENINVDKGVIKVASFWHDVVFVDSNGEEVDNVGKLSKYLRHYLLSVGFSSKEAGRIAEVVRTHEFGDKPVTLEGKILQDADKLEVISEKRAKSSFEAYKKGEFPRIILASYFRTGLKWIPKLEKSMHFRTSRDLMRRRIKKALVSGVFRGYVKEFKVEKEYEKMLDELKTV